MRMLSNTSSVIVMLLLMQVNNVSAEPVTGALFPDTFPGSGGLAEPMMGSDLPPAYPEWPERSVRKQIIPPPPGGPYMSSAMSGIDAFPAHTGGLRYESRKKVMHSPDFNVDMPWPETPERDPPELWMPESGEYRFVPEEVVRELESSPPGRRLEQRMYQPYPRYPPAPPLRRPYYGYY